MKTSISAFVLAASCFVLSACNQQDETSITASAPGAVDTMTVDNARLVLPAVAGNPAAVFFELGNGGSDPMTLESVAVDRSQMAMLHDVIDEAGVKRMVAMEPLTLKSNESVSFQPGGKHVMAMKLDKAVQAGETIEVSLTFANGQTLAFPAEVVAPGQGE